MNKVRKKLFEAKKLIANTPTKKEGTNPYSKYDYFTPSQVSKLVFDACTEVGLVTGFDIKRDNGAFLGCLFLYDIDSDDSMYFSMATDMPEIKATNVTQKLGGMATYVQRYLEMATFGIVDNNLDPDSQENRGNKSKPKISAAQFQKGADQVANSTITIAQFETKIAKYELTEQQSKSLMLLKSKLV